MRAAALALVTTLLTILAPQPAAAQDQAPPPLPPKLDVDAALRALRTQQIYRAPGAVAYFDTELIRRELTPNLRVLVAPFSGPRDEEGHYRSADEHLEQVYRPVNNWAEDHGMTLITIEGLKVSSTKGVSSVPSDLSELRQHTAQYDVTEALWSILRHAQGADTDEAELDHPPIQVVAPTPQQTAHLAAQLRETGVYNAPGREDLVDLPLDLLREKTGMRVRATAFPVLAPGEPVVDYAPALAERFPGEVVLVAHGAWLDVAGPHPAELVSARDYAYGRFEMGTFQQGLTMTNRIGTVLLRAKELLTEHPFGRPQPRTLRQLIAEVAPWLVGGSGLLLGGVPLARWWSRRAARARAERAALREVTIKTFADIAELGRVLLAEDGHRNTAAAAERHATATALFEQADTAEAVAEVRKIARQGRRLLPRRRKQARG